MEYAGKILHRSADNFMSRHVINYLEYKGIFTSSILLAGNRIGIYFLERGADLKGSNGIR